MIPRNRKLTTTHFSFFKKGGKVFRSPHLSLRLYPAATGSPSRFAFVVSKKVSAKSTERNRLKRAGYRAIEGFLAHAREGFSCVFFLNKTRADEKVSPAEIAKEVAKVLSEARVVL